MPVNPAFTGDFELWLILGNTKAIGSWGCLPEGDSLAMKRKSRSLLAEANTFVRFGEGMEIGFVVAKENGVWVREGRL